MEAESDRAKQLDRASASRFRLQGDKIALSGGLSFLRDARLISAVADVVAAGEMRTGGMVGIAFV